MICMNRTFPIAGETLEPRPICVVVPVVHHQSCVAVAVEPPGCDEALDELFRLTRPVHAGGNSLVRKPPNVPLRSILSGEVKEQFQVSQRRGPADS
jgi:hypothetical protein